MLKIKVFLKTTVHSKTALSSHFSGGTPQTLSISEVRRTCDDLNYLLLQVNIIELCTVNMYTVLKLTNKYSLVVVVVVVIEFLTSQL